MQLAIITTHPVQYYAPVFRLMHQRKNISIKVFYTAGEVMEARNDPGFGKQFEWDIPLLNDYPYEWAINVAANPGSHHPKGIITPNLINQINNWKPDAVLVFGWNYVSHLKIIKYYKNKIPVYFRGDSTLLDYQNWLKKIIKTFYLRRVYRYVDHAFYTGKNNKTYFKHYGLKDTQLSFAPHAIDNERFAQQRTKEVQQLRKKLNIPDDALIILFAGKLEAKKSPDILLKAFLNINNAAAHLLFVGNGDMESTLKNLVPDNQGNVHFIDFQNQSFMPVVYQTCNIFCLPSSGPNETWGLAVNEAMACKKAVIVSDKVGCAIDLVVKNKNGMIFNAGLVTDLQEKLASLIKDGKSALNTMGIESAAIIASWNFKQQVNCMENVMLNNYHE